MADVDRLFALRAGVAVIGADNPGQWMIHCRNVYQPGAGMMTLLGYRA